MRVNFIKTLMTKAAQDKAARLDILEITEGWSAGEFGTSFTRKSSLYTWATIGAALIALSLITASEHNADDAFKVLAMFAAGMLIVVIAPLMHYYMQEKWRLIAEAKDRLAADPQVHAEYLAAAERLEALNAALAQAAAAEAAEMQSAAAQAQICAANAQAQAAKIEMKSALTSRDRSRLENEIRSATSTIEIKQRHGSDATAAKTRLAIAQAKLASGKK